LMVERRHCCELEEELRDERGNGGALIVCR